jgi:hypothetical protein
MNNNPSNILIGKAAPPSSRPFTERLPVDLTARYPGLRWTLTVSWDGKMWPVLPPSEAGYAAMAAIVDANGNVAKAIAETRAGWFAPGECPELERWGTAEWAGFLMTLTEALQVMAAEAIRMRDDVARLKAAVRPPVASHVARRARR